MFMCPIFNHNWMNISTIYIYNNTSIKRYGGGERGAQGSGGET